MSDFVLGKDARLYISATAEDALGSLAVMNNVKDLTLSLEAAEADVTTRANAGWTGITPSLRTAEVTFDMVWKPADAGFVIFKDAFLSGDSIEMAVLDGDKSVSGSQGLKASFGITGFSRSEPLPDAIIVSVTAKLTLFDEWITI